MNSPSRNRHVPEFAIVISLEDGTPRPEWRNAPDKETRNRLRCWINSDPGLRDLCDRAKALADERAAA
jgi:hypothetical protein